MRFARIDQSQVARWWWTVDRWSLAALGMLIGFGVVMSLAASPPVAERIGYDGLHFVRRHLAMLPLALGLMFAVSLQPPRTIRRIAMIGFGISLVLLALTFVIGVEIKGARRWINFPGLSLQPSEFVKPTFAVVAAWLFSEQKLRPRFPGNLICIALFVLVIAMLIKQPDIGMAAVVAAVWFAQFYMAGMRLYWVAAGVLAGLGGVVGAYMYLPHVRVRVDHFLDRRAVRVHRAARIFANVAGRQPLRPPRCDRPTDPVRPPGGDQYGLEPALDPDQRHDLAFSVVWRVLNAGARARHGDDARADAAASRGR
jgi:cell division protein FtsW